jgi:hypothetical protein
VYVAGPDFQALFFKLPNRVPNAFLAVQLYFSYCPLDSFYLQRAHKMKTLLLSLVIISASSLSACTWHSVGKHDVITLDTGNEVVDAASYVAAGAYLSKKIEEDRWKNGDIDLKKDPKVKALNEAFERAKSRKISEQAAQTSNSSTDFPNGNH